MKIAIQGVLGSFHHQVADQFFGKSELVPCLSFVEIPELLIQGKVDAGVMAIENSLVGSILPNYALIDEFNLTITGEVHLPIHHHLMALPGQQLSDIREVWSHPMALLQCGKFFRTVPHIKLVEAMDTAAVAAQIKAEDLTGVAAIASKHAAEIYGLDVLASNIQTREENYTRFFVVQTEQNTISVVKKNKASLKIITKHKTGSLTEALLVFARKQLNLSKIQSLPIIDEPWNYAFFVDVIFENIVPYHEAISEIQAMGNQVKILGEYTQSQRTYDR
ncbi:prephenate dehydratase [Flavobacteriaceae bacterium F08102]|nr:prephenate dehydratase [Flavobacteriaceae bacterium F08102]